jgi:hypothetical protein
MNFAIMSSAYMASHFLQLLNIMFTMATPNKNSVQRNPYSNCQGLYCATLRILVSLLGSHHALIYNVYYGLAVSYLARPPHRHYCKWHLMSVAQ